VLAIFLAHWRFKYQHFLDAESPTKVGVVEASSKFLNGRGSVERMVDERIKASVCEGEIRFHALDG
jgi:hypothetical protein